jgi:hypothetical protein
MNSGDMQHIAGYSFAEGYAKAIQELEKSTCESCKYWNGNEECELLVYNYWVNDFCDDRCMITSPSFSCNKWESKDD